MLNCLLVGRYLVLRARGGERGTEEGGAWDDTSSSLEGQIQPCSGLMGHILVEGKCLADKLIPVGLFELTAPEGETQELTAGRDAGKEQCPLSQ